MFLLFVKMIGLKKAIDNGLNGSGFLLKALDFFDLEHNKRPNNLKQASTESFFEHVAKRDNEYHKFCKKITSNYYKNELWFHNIYNTPLALLLHLGIFPGNEMYSFGVLTTHLDQVRQYEMVTCVDNGFN